MIEIVPAIMSGGSGTRLWPLSVAARPKQFHALAGAHTMIQDTVLRLSGETGGARFSAPLVIGGAAHAGLIADQMAAIGAKPLLTVLEPQGRNTAATAVLAALAAKEQAPPGSLVLLAPADHVIADAGAFRALVAAAAPHARDRIVTFGVTPTAPETGYGYILAGEEIAPGLSAIARFAEKPSLPEAEAYLAQGGYSWNAGIFLFDPDLLLAEFDAYAPEISAAVALAYSEADREGSELRLGEAFTRVPAAAFDVAVMEKTHRAAVAPCAVGWADVGSFSEIWRLSAASADANVLQGDAVEFDCSGTLLRGEGVVVAAAGLTDMIVVATPEAVIVVPKHRAQDVKKLWELAQAHRKSGE